MNGETDLMEKNLTGDAFIREIVRRYEGEEGMLIPMLQDIQAEYGYLPADLLRTLSADLKVPLARIFGVATFYASFRLAPKGQHEVTLCMGTVCYLKGSGRISETICSEFGLEPGGTTSDRLFTLNLVNCVGACALAPVMIVDGKYYDAVTPDSAIKILRRLSDGGDAQEGKAKGGAAPKQAKEHGKEHGKETEKAVSTPVESSPPAGPPTAAKQPQVEERPQTAKPSPVVTPAVKGPRPVKGAAREEKPAHAPRRAPSAGGAPVGGRTAVGGKEAVSGKAVGSGRTPARGKKTTKKAKPASSPKTGKAGGGAQKPSKRTPSPKKAPKKASSKKKIVKKPRGE